ncbi:MULTISPECIES: mechanosensitive ion channel family protein [unclassified Knoellia]|uniref:mechanosensitive ion channel family protein n=1 Tax=Knoellia altitudinis TaxID=3404795 RepID=UPI00361DD269
MTDSLEDAGTDALRTIAVFLPKLVVFLLILIIGMFVAKAIGKAVDKILERVGFDRAVERGGVKKALEKSKYDASDIVGKLVYYTLLLFVLQLAFGVFGPNPISDLLTGVIAFLPKAIVAIIIVVVAAAIATAVRELLSNTLGGLSYGKTLANIVAFFIIGLGVIAALNQVGIATTVTLPVLIAVLGTISGILIVGVGGGLIKPMQHRWESYLVKAEGELPKVKAEAANTPGVREQAEQAKSKAKREYDDSGSSGSTSSTPTQVFDQGTGEGGSTTPRR